MFYFLQRQIIQSFLEHCTSLRIHGAVANSLLQAYTNKKLSLHKSKHYCWENLIQTEICRYLKHTAGKGMLY